MQNARLTIYASDFSEFSKAISGLNRRAKRFNAGLKQNRYEMVSRIPVSHVGRTVTVEVKIKDRSKVLWQELSGILERFEARVARCDRPGFKPTPQEQMTASAIAASESLPKPHDWVAAGKGECDCPDCLREKVKADADRLKIQTLPPTVAKPVSFPIPPASRQWGLWVPCADEVAARAAAGFLAAITKIGLPQVECRG